MPDHPLPMHELLPAGVLLVSNTDRDGCISYCNQALVHATGYAPDELLGQPLELLHHPDMPAQIARDLRATLAAGDVWSGIVQHRRRDGRGYWVRTAATPVAELDRHVGYVMAHAAPRPEDVQLALRLYGAMRDGDRAWPQAPTSPVVVHRGLALPADPRETGIQRGQVHAMDGPGCRGGHEFDLSRR